MYRCGKPEMEIDDLCIHRGFDISYSNLISSNKQMLKKKINVQNLSSHSQYNSINNSIYIFVKSTVRILMYTITIGLIGCYCT